MTRCHEIRPYLEAFIDDELSTDNALRVEEHLGICGRCREEVQLGRALKRSIRDTVLHDARPSAAFMNRLSSVLAEEQQYETQRMAPPAMTWRRRAVPVAAAAAAVVVFGLSDGQWVKQFSLGGPFSLSEKSSLSGNSADSSSGDVSSSTMPGQYQASSLMVNPHNIIDQLVRYHQTPIEPEVTERSALLRFEPQVGVPMRVPELHHFGARFLGASVISVERHQAASLRYNLGEHRVTVYVVNPQVVPVRALQDLQPRVVGDRAVFVGTRHGYSIAAIEQRGVGYVMATDLDDRESAELLASIR